MSALEIVAANRYMAEIEANFCSLPVFNDLFAGFVVAVIIIIMYLCLLYRYFFALL